MDWPAYTLNKAFALSALILLLVSVARSRFVPSTSNVRLMSAAGAFAMIHVLLSLALLSPEYYGKHFPGGRLSAVAGLSMLLGAIVTVTLFMARTRQRPGAGFLKLPVVAFLAGLHALLLGIVPWTPVADWPGFLPPITLISFLLGLVALLLAPWRKEPSGARQDDVHS